MLSKLLIDSLRENFYDKFDKLSDRSLYLKEAITDIKHHPGVKDLEESQRMDFEDNLYAVISSASVLGYYIGLQEGADIIQSLTSSDLPEKMRFRWHTAIIILHLPPLVCVRTGVNPFQL